MQKIVATILLLAFTAQSFNQGLMYIDYLVDKAAYEKRCVNKARPQLKCHGKCQLMKKIEEREEQERGTAPELKLASKIEVLSSKSWFLLPSPVSTGLSKPDFFLSASGAPIDQPSSFFHPPNC